MDVTFSLKGGLTLSLFLEQTILFCITDWKKGMAHIQVNHIGGLHGVYVGQYLTKESH